MNEKDLRDCFAMFSLIGLLGSTKITPYEFKYEEIAEGAWKLADAMLEARNKQDDEEELGIAAVKPKRTYIRKTYNR